MSQVQLSGSSAAYLEQGSGQPVMLLHSAGSSSAQWRALVDRLSVRFHVIAPDLYGYGSSANWPGSGVFRLADEAALVRTLLDRLDEPVHLVGHSYGGAVALQVAREHGDSLRSLTLIEPVAFHLLRGGDAIDAVALREIRAVADVVAHSLASGDYLRGFGHFVDYWSGDGAWAGMPEDKRAALVARLAKVALDFQAAIHEPSHLGEVERISLPTLLLHGDRSPLPTRRICQRLARAMQNASTATILGAGHMAPLTHRDQVNDLIVAHLDAHAVEPWIAAATMRTPEQGVSLA
jgi:pimeloyl-ACP methyl ester carboxylesterase